MNPAALVFWTILGLIGWLTASTTGAVVAVLAGLIFSLVVTAVYR